MHQWTCGRLSAAELGHHPALRVQPRCHMVAKGRYPRVLAKAGPSPVQYPDPDDDDEEEEDDA
jgi:hypothetical protein